MNKKFLSAILFGALMVTSTGTFVSCKDYDDEIKDLQTQIDNLATKSDVEAKLSQLQAAITAAKAEAEAAAKDATAAELAALKAEIAALGDVEAKIDEMLAKVQESVDADMAAYKTEIAAIIEKAEALVGQVADYVTSVELVYSNSNQTETFYPLWVVKKNFGENWSSSSTTSYVGDLNSFLEKNGFDEVYDEDGKLIGYKYVRVNNNEVNQAYNGESLETTTVTELTNTFGPSETSFIKFTAGDQHQRGDKFVVRVSPTNAQLTPDMISLVNSQGTVLDILKVVDVKPYSGLLTRGANTSGLWEVEVELKEYEKDAFNAARYKKNTYSEILYAVQVNNTISTAATRNVVSSYDLSLGFHSAFYGLGKLNYFVDGKCVEYINNRTYGNWSKSFTGDNTELYKEMVWNDEWSPAVAAITKGEKQNVWWTADDRGGENIYPAVQGEAMKIEVSSSMYWYSEVSDASSYVRGLYVTLDEKNAQESAPSELNAWNSYLYDGLNEVVEGTSIEITVNSKNGEAINDVIGFRVYAVNHDGTLVDPDGRAFYVRLGEKAAETQVVKATIAPKSTSDITRYVELTAEQKAIISKYYGVTPAEVKPNKNNPLITSGAYKQDKSPRYEVTFVKDAKGTAAAKAAEMNYAKFTLIDGVEQFIDGGTYKQTIVYKNATGHVLGEVECELTKAMPTEFPADFAFRPKQEVEEGTGKFIAYMIPENDYAVTTMSANGIKDLNNVFYGLDNHYFFSFANSTVVDNAAAPVTVVDEDITDEEYVYELNIAKKYISVDEWHAVTVKYLYREVSTYQNAKGEWVVGDDHPVTYDKSLEAKYACWEDASAFAWGTYKKDNAVLSYKPALQWTADGKGETANLEEIWSTNSYNNDYFGLDLEALVITNQWLKLADEDAVKLVVNGQTNPYFVPSIDETTGVITFAQKETQVDAAPTADHEETLVITLVDAFGHEVPVSLAVTVKAPEKK